MTRVRCLIIAVLIGVTGLLGAVGSPASASTGAGASVAQAFETINCTRSGTLWTCREGTTGNVVAQLQDYAHCRVETDCGWQYVPGPAGHESDHRWFLTGTPT
jgi:hypothetical protein